MSRTTELKSLAHPDRPYAGTAHEWRGFVKDVGESIGQPVERVNEETQALFEAVWQKQNFGPDLD